MAIQSTRSQAVSSDNGSPGITSLFFFAIITRATCDPLFDALKPEAGGGIGPGAAVNVLMLAIATVLFLKQPRYIAGAVVPMWSPFLIASLVSIIFAPSIFSSTRLFIVQLSYCAVFAIPYYLIRSGITVERSVYMIIFSSLVPACTGVVEIILGNGALQGEGFRVSGTFSHPNIFAFYLLLTIAAIFYILKSNGRQLRPKLSRALWLYMIILLALLVCTKTRSAWLGTVLLFGLHGLFNERRYLLYVCVIPALLLMDTSVQDRLTDLTSTNDSPTEGDVNSYRWRVILWEAGLNWMDSQFLWFGYGLDSFKIYSPQFFPFEGQDSWDPHNVYVQLLFEVGVIGLVSYFWIFFCLLRRVASRFYLDRKGTVILIALILCYLASSWTDNMLYYLSFNWYFWFLMGTVCSLHRRESCQR